jgi:leucoanthocyanidin dioxygenase
VNHGVAAELLGRMARLSRAFFRLPMPAKQAYANDPGNYDGYGSRLGVARAATLDWGDYFFLRVFPEADRDAAKWPASPPAWRYPAPSSPSFLNA